MNTARLPLPILIVAALIGAGSTARSEIIDPTGDFTPTFTGAMNADLDVIRSEVVFDRVAGTFTFSATMAGDLGLTPNAVYVWGLNRGQGTARFASLGIDGVLFDSVVAAFADRTGVVNDLVPTPTQTLTLGASEITISGATITVVVPKSALPSEGFGLEDYTWNLWPRIGFGNNALISDFAPDNSNVLVTAVPEPTSLLLIACGLGICTAAARRIRLG